MQMKTPTIAIGLLLTLALPGCAPLEDDGSWLEPHSGGVLQQATIDQQVVVPEGRQPLPPPDQVAPPIADDPAQVSPPAPPAEEAAAVEPVPVAPPMSDAAALAALVPRPPAAPVLPWLARPITALTVSAVDGESATVVDDQGRTHTLRRGDLVGPNGARFVGVEPGVVVFAEIQFDMAGQALLIRRELPAPEAPVPAPAGPTEQVAPDQAAPDQAAPAQVAPEAGQPASGETTPAL